MIYDKPTDLGENPSYSGMEGVHTGKNYLLNLLRNRKFLIFLLALMIPVGIYNFRYFSTQPRIDMKQEASIQRRLAPGALYVPPSRSGGRQVRQLGEITYRDVDGDGTLESIIEITDPITKEPVPMIVEKLGKDYKEGLILRILE